MSQKPHTFRNGIWYASLFSVLSMFLIFKLTPGFSIRMSLAQIHWGYIILGFPVLFMVWLAKAYRMFVIAQGMGLEVDLASFLKIYLATCFISHITPFSSGGTPLQIYLIRKKGVPLGKATAITAVDLGLHSALFLVLIPAAVFFNLKMLPVHWEWAYWRPVFFGVGTGLFIVAVLFFLLTRQRHFLGRFKKVKWIQKTRRFIFQNKWLKNLGREWELFREGWFTLIHHNPSSVGWAMMATILYWLFYFMLAPVLIWSLGRPASFGELMGRQLLYNFGQILIPTPGGSGGSELLLTYLFKSITGISLIGPFVFCWKFYTFYSSLILGGYYFFRLTSVRVDQSGWRENQ